MTNNNFEKTQKFPIFNGGFSFSNYSCDILVDSYYNRYGKNLKNINIRNDDQRTIDFIFKESLYNKNNISMDHNILVQFMSIEPNNIEALHKFFTDNGFIFNGSFDEYTRYKHEVLDIIIKRVSCLVQLIMELQKETKNFKILFQNTMYLLLTKPFQIFNNNKELVYESIHYPIYSILGGYREPIFFKNPNRIEEYSDAEIDFIDSPRNTSDIFKLNVASNYLLNENITGIDKLQLKFLYKILTYPYFFKIKYTNNIIEFESEEKLENTLKADKELQSMLIQITKHIIKSELEHNIKNIKPSYDIDSLLGSWKIPDLLSAIYFSIFFLNPKFDIIKKCSNPTCSSYFSVLHSNKN